MDFFKIKYYKNGALLKKMFDCLPKKAVNCLQMKSFNRIKNPLCTSIENLIVKLLSKFRNDPSNHVEVISCLRFKKVVSRETRLEIEV